MKLEDAEARCDLEFTWQAVGL